MVYEIKVVCRFVFWFIPAIIFCSPDINAQKFHIEGTIKGANEGFVTLSFFRIDLNKRRTDTIQIKHRKFRYDGRISGATFATIEIYTSHSSSGKTAATDFFIEPGTIKIDYEGEPNEKVEITGNKAQQEFKAFRKLIDWEFNEMRRLSLEYNLVASQLKTSQIDFKTAEKKRLAVDTLYNPILKSRVSKELAYVRKNSSSYVSLMLLYYYIGRLPNDSIDSYYTGLSNQVKGSTLDFSFLEYNSRYRKAIAAEYPFDKLKLNEPAPPFSAYNTIKKDSFNLKNLKGKVVILDFWGLYCLPCLKANPQLENIRKRFGSDKLVIIAVNNNEPNELWEMISYIKKNRLEEWVHVFSNKSVMDQKNFIYKGKFEFYQGLEVPRTIVIDKDGNVVFKSSGYSESEINNLRVKVEEIMYEK